MSDFNDPQTAVDAGRQALKSWNGYPWYDAKNDDLQRVVIQRDEPPPSTSSSSSFDFGFVLQVIVWTALAAVIAVVCYFLVRVFLMRDRREKVADAPDAGHARRIEALPMNLEEQESDLLAAARRHYASGNLAKAIVCYFGYQLVELDRRQIIHLTQGKTNRQYLREFGRPRAAAAACEPNDGHFRRRLLRTSHAAARPLRSLLVAAGRVPNPRRTGGVMIVHAPDRGAVTAISPGSRSAPGVSNNARRSTPKGSQQVANRACVCSRAATPPGSDNGTISRPPGALRDPGLIAVIPPGWKPQVVCLLFLLFLTGCGSSREQNLETIYGERSGFGASQSVNGTAVFADMFSQAGHRVNSWHVLSPRLEKADCIVWFPDDFRPPEAPVIKWLEKWLRAKPGRTLIYVGRDFDAAPWYWKQLEPNASAADKSAIHDEAVAADAAFHTERGIRREGREGRECKWFEIDWDTQPRKVDTLKGDETWTSGIDASKAAIELNSRMLPANVDCEELLDSGDDVLIGRQTFSGSRLYLVANGSFLLNAMLVNLENRKLAGKLIDAIGSSGKRVIFLESRPHSFFFEELKKHHDKKHGKQGAAAVEPVQAMNADSDDEEEETETSPPIRNDDPSSSPPSGLEIADVWPTNWILLHFAALGIIFCFWKLPLFGRPLDPDPAETSDFGKHIDAVAAVLKRSGDVRVAQARIEHYHQIVKKTGVEP